MGKGTRSSVTKGTGGRTGQARPLTGGLRRSRRSGASTGRKLTGGLRRRRG